MKMTFSSLENSILMEVIDTPLDVADLHKKYVERSRCSRAGFYKALTSLKKKEVVIEKGRILSVNKIWLADSYDFFRKLVRQKTTPSYLAEQVSRLRKEEYLSYSFNSMEKIDIFILNLLYDLSLLKLDIRAYILEPHEFFVLLNDARTKRIMSELNSIGSSVHLLIEGGTPIDKEIVKSHLPRPADGYVSSSKAKLPARIFHVVGDVCIELKLHKSLAASIDRLYAQYDEVTEEFVDHLKKLVVLSGKHEIRIYRDKAKADLIKKRFKRYF